MSCGNRSAFNGSIPAERLISEPVFMYLGFTAAGTSLIGIPGNVLVILTVFLNPTLRTAPNWLVLSLSVCDLLFLATVLPFHAYCYLTGHPLPSTLCWVIGFLTNWFLGSSVLSTGAIALNRYIAIVLSSKYGYFDGTKSVFIISACTFTVPFLLICPIFDSKYGTFGFDATERHCGWLDTEVVRAIMILCTAVLPFVFMTVCYIHIMLHVIASRKRVGAIGRTTNAFGPRRSTETRLSFMMAMVYVVYMVTTFPAFISNLIQQSGVCVTLSTSTIVFSFVWTSSAINPIVYGLVNKSYREAYKTVANKIASQFRSTETQSM